MSRKFTIALFAVVCGLALLSAAIVSMAQTGDSDPPSSEAVCDHLIGGTPGLYGLCIAFAEAQDCEPDYSDPQVDPFAHCQPASAKIIAAYDRKKQNGDPELPGVAGSCPCFDADDLISQAEPVCLPGSDPVSTYWNISGTNNGTSFTAQVIDYTNQADQCLYAPSPNPPYFISIDDLSEAQVQACRDLIVGACPPTSA